jgi:UDP-N-acetylmuramoyl-L-alanyl-D-glutamate--2,6-diaminopimelate ligase
MKLSTLLDTTLEIDITGISLDSRALQPGEAFFALPGVSGDGRDYIDQAIAAGASVIVRAGDEPGLDHQAGVPIVSVVGLADRLGEIASTFYGHPSHKLKVIGVTGTNGKSSICHHIAQLFSFVGETCAIMGTLGNGTLDALEPTGLTTVDVFSVHRFLADCVKRQIPTVAMEVSSHALAQGRVAGVQFFAALFTNLTQDHLDFHEDLASYAAAKQQLFEMPGLSMAVFNLDDAVGAKWARLYRDRYPCIGVSLDDQSCDGVKAILAKEIALIENGFRFKLQSSIASGEAETHLIGRFAISNVLMSFAVVQACCDPGLAPTLLAKLREITAIKGRLQMLKAKDKPTVIIDYAHTPDALEKVLEAAKDHTSHHVHVVFGCGGDRDATKRAPMAKAAENYADHVTVTSDNPRREDPKRIAADILKGFNQLDNIVVELDRAQAIQKTIENAHKDDIVVIAGKGHETYQTIGETQHPFDDAKQAEMALNPKIVSQGV